jgi:rod shape-determining protein MreD
VRTAFWGKVDAIARRLTPFGLTVILVLIGAVPLHVPGFASVTPLLPMIGIYYWAIYRPDLMPVAAVFFIGLLFDALSGAPMGVNAAIFVIVHGIIDSQRRFFAGKSFMIVWLGFFLVSAGALLATWLLVSAFHGTLVKSDALMVQYVITLGCFPLLSWALLRWQRAFLRQA